MMNSSDFNIKDQVSAQPADDDNYSTQLQNDPVGNVDDLCLPPESSNKNFPPDESDATISDEPKPIDSSSLMCKEHLCVLNTNDQTLKRKEAVELKNGNEHIMISYNRRSAKDLCTKIVEELRKLGYQVWIDEDDVSGDIQESVAIAIENSFVVLMAISEEYYKSDWCRAEAEYAFQCRKVRIPMLTQSRYKPKGWLGFNIGSRRRVDFSQPEFDQPFNLLVREIEAVRKSLKKDPISLLTNNQPITTMEHCSTYPRNVQRWNADDVIQWLKREQLEIFQSALTSFTGESLWQLYRIKFTSPPDYYRTIENLLIPKPPSRLFYNLRFIAALESLFSSSNSIFMTDWFFLIIFTAITILLVVLVVLSIL